jgi:hypothetical protein
MVVIQFANGQSQQIPPTQFVRPPAVGESIVGLDGVQHNVVNVIHRITPQGPMLILQIQ